MDLLKVYVGYDAREDVAWQVCRNSLLRWSTDVGVYPLKQPTLRELGLYRRPVDGTASTEFSLTRFLTPYLAQTAGWSVFVDCDFVFTAPINDVLEGLDPTKAAYVVQHDYTPRFAMKMDGQRQASYPRKNWSSFIVFNGSHPDVQALTPDVVNTASPADLHRFNWIKKDSDIGSLPLTWNFLVGEYDKTSETPKAIHYTNGGPWFSNWGSVDYADLWLAEREMLPAATAGQVA